MVLYFQIYVIISIVFAIVIILLWVMKKFINMNATIALSNYLIFYSLILLSAGLISGFHNGLTGAELKTLIRLIVFFLFVFVIFDQYNLRHTFLLFFAITIPLLFSSYMLFKDYSQVTGIISLLDLYRLKPGGIYPNSNLLGYVLMVAIPFWIAVCIWYKAPFVKIFSFIIAFIMSFALILTNSRASILGISMAIILFFIWARKIKYLVLLLLTIAVIFLSVPAVWNLISLGLRFERGTTSRDVIWTNTIKMIKQNPILGIGLGNYAKEYDPYFISAYERGFVKEMPNAHFFILNATVELGIVGLFLSLIIYILPIAEGIKALRRTKLKEDRALVYSIIATIIAIYAHSIFEAGGIISGGRPYADIIFWLLFCILIKVNRLPKGYSERIFS